MEEISIRELIEILIRRKGIIIGSTVVCVLVSFIMSFFILEPVYETKMVLMASNFSDRLQANSVDNSNINKILDSLSQYPSMTLETYRQQIKAPRVLRETIQLLGLEDEYDIESLSRNITLETIKDTNLISIKMKHNDPEKAAQIVNKVGENFINFVSSKAQEHASKSSLFIENQMEVEKEKLEAALEELKEFLSEPKGVSELGLELDARLLQITDYKQRLTDLVIRKEALISGINVVVSESNKGGNQIIIMESSVDGDTSFGSTGKIHLERTETLLKIELAEVESNITQLDKHIGLLQNQIEELQVELQDKKYHERLINQKVDFAQNTYDAFIKKYEELRVTESSQVGEATITVISKAFPTTTPVGPNKALNLAVAGILGLMMGVFIAFFLEYWKTSSPVKINI
ncbi:GumC family protein [Serpentinicella alkaliphila]|uniref:Uncharacterized protein involved in exopolysaccharide biosynthesis n=1 Tax=Serpentinicella alkaliphila TaxID=1734049 RepID=A0A4R2T5X3_9FIRM|nr:Wzz/FepE/Etk N-terminal domain-containing protein [Serpentinicella alkaliphila]QUH25052.1 hypothetical protein HZR23_04125 [Serpentinicella alkaliphila]TCP98417.1 uncharacterized protein involved in exopolysaccharide biosynthesis [Serpentinicella alkaliphila]